jgi:hypothetical protein
LIEILNSHRTRAREWRAFLFLVLLFTLATCAVAQTKSVKTKTATTPTAPPTLTRTTTRHEARRLGYGSTLSIVGAPAGSITVEAWSRDEIDVTADIELHAETEEDLALLATVNSFVFDTDGSHVRLITTGTHDRKFMKKLKTFPARLSSMPWRIDYHIKVPAVVDVDVSAGRGPLSFTGIEGSLQLNAGASDVIFDLAGGDVTATILSGTVLFRANAESWRGRGATVRLASGTMTVALPARFNADIDAAVLRTGEVTGEHDAFAPRHDATQTSRSWSVRAGSGGATLKFEVGDGAIRFAQLGEGKPKQQER